MKLSIPLLGVLTLPLCLTSGNPTAESNPFISAERFLITSNRATEYRNERLISVEAFWKLSQEPNTLILDTRSAAAYDDFHIRGAVNLNFSDFTAEKLAQVIPSKDYRILIYCNNNFESELASLLDKKADLALNVPTFINLYGYGYHNLYELKDRIRHDDARLEFEGRSVDD